MLIQKIFSLWNDCDQVKLEYFQDESLSGDYPAMLVVPGGGYGCVCYETEGRPIAERFARFGFRCFVLTYRVAPERFPKPQQDILRAIKFIRSKAAEWGIIKNNIAVCGFSAGGHLCLSAGTLFEEINADNGDEADRESSRPDAMLLAYPVVTFGPEGHQGSGMNLLGEEFEARKAEFSLENRITEKTPPAYIWHTAEDKGVPPANSILLFQAMRRKNLSAELHIFPHGSHGRQLGYGRWDIVRWPEEAVLFLKDSCGFRLPEKPKKRTVVLTFDDACKNHLTYVAPLLKKYGFGATFFICRFSEKWQEQHGEHLLTGPEIRQLSDMGFEIGNHSWNHPDMRGKTVEENDQDILRLNQFLEENGVPRPVSFAYPGGPFAENLVPLLKKYQFKYARTTERRVWKKAEDHSLRIPAYALAGDLICDFYNAVSQPEENEAMVLVFHGLPDVVHPYCSNSREIFEMYLQYLADNHYEVLSMKDFGQR